MARKQKETDEWFRNAHLHYGETLISRGEGPTREELTERARHKDAGRTA